MCNSNKYLLLLASLALVTACGEGQFGGFGECGNDLLDTLESCDDGNRDNGDGCNSACAIETGWLCDAESCSAALCGDGVVADTETCDDGNPSVNDNCPSGPLGTCAAATGQNDSVAHSPPE